MSAQRTPAPETQKDHDLIFFTASEVATLLKMNPQVIARKLQSGEMEGYKLGKDWRVSKTQLRAYLESRSNQRARSTAESRTLDAFFENGVLKSIPTTRTKRLHVLKFLVAKLDAKKVYAESELNDFLSVYHADVCTLRREMIINRLMVRSAGKYKVVGWNR